MRDSEEVMNILITGASRGLGKAMAEVFARNGHTVITPPRDMMDVTITNRVASAATMFSAIHGNGIQLLINNAGGSCESFDANMDLNARGPYLVTRYFWPLLVKGRGRVINISSREGLSGDTFGNRLYSVSKAALNAITRMQAKNDDGVIVNACCPGPFDSSDQAACINAADTPIWLATRPEKDSGHFYINREIVPW